MEVNKKRLCLNMIFGSYLNKTPTPESVFGFIFLKKRNILAGLFEFRRIKALPQRVFSEKSVLVGDLEEKKTMKINSPRFGF